VYRTTIIGQISNLGRLLSHLDLYDMPLLLRRQWSAPWPTTLVIPREESQPIRAWKLPVDEMQESVIEGERGIDDRFHSLAGINRQFARFSPKCRQIQGAHSSMAIHRAFVPAPLSDGKSV
jgi:hypothetical protein